MQQIETELDLFKLISQGNNSHIHRVQASKVTFYKIKNKFNIYIIQSYVIKSVYHTKQGTISQQQNFPKSDHLIECNDLLNEWEILSTLNHPHIITPFKFQQSSTLKMPDETVECCSLQMEGALCDYYNLLKSSETHTQDTFPFSQQMKYFRQISNAVEYLHNHQITHNDIKLENIFVFNRDTAKLADFGFASRDQENQGKRWERRALNFYSAPEIIKQRNSRDEIKELNAFLASIAPEQTEYSDYVSEFSADIYALTSSLFIAVFKRPPVFHNFPTMNDPLYSLLCNNPDDFWDLEQLQSVEQELKGSGVSLDQLESLKDLIESGLCDQDARISTDEWQKHEFWRDFECDLLHNECKPSLKKHRNN